MSVASPKNRAEFKEYILTKLGAPVLQINVSDAQMDCAINDAFQYYNERSHFLGTERMYLSFTAGPEFVEHFKSFDSELVTQVGGPEVSAEGIVDELQLVDPGSGYPLPFPPDQTFPTQDIDDPIVGTQTNQEIETETESEIQLDIAGGNGTGLTVYCGEGRTVSQGLISAVPYMGGSGYVVGDFVRVMAGGNDAIFKVTKVKTKSAVFGVSDIRKQNNYIVLPDDVVGVQQVLHRGGFLGAFGMGGILPGGMVGPMLMGGMFGDSCAGIGFDLVSYVAMREYLATLQFLFEPPTQYNFNQRTHRLFIDSNRFRASLGVGTVVCLECMVKPSPDVFPDLWNDLWLKEYCIALVQQIWGRNLTKYGAVQLPGGITLNGDAILNEANATIKGLKERFALDWADPALDAVG